MRQTSFGAAAATAVETPSALMSAASSWRPVIVGTNGGLELRADGRRLQLAGVCVMGVPGGNEFTRQFRHRYRHLLGGRVSTPIGR